MKRTIDAQSDGLTPKKQKTFSAATCPSGSVAVADDSNDLFTKDYQSLDDIMEEAAASEGYTVEEMLALPGFKPPSSMLVYQCLDDLIMEEQLRMATLSNLLAAMRAHRLRNWRKYRSKLKVRRRRGKMVYPRRPVEKLRNPQDVLARFDRKETTGLEEELFDHVLDLVKNYYIAHPELKPRKIIKSDYSLDFQLTLVLYYLRHAPKLKQLGQLFTISEATCDRWIRKYFPILCEVLQDNITLPEWTELEPGFCGSHFLIDCTSHVRRRVHPGQHLYYRGDKHCHFLTAQVVTSLRGLVYAVVIALGHNNDQGVFNQTFRKEVETRNLIGLGDRGYHHPIVVPNVKPKELRRSPAQYSSQHSARRSPAEIINSCTKNWTFAERKVAISPEFQAMGLHIIYCLANLLFKYDPERIYANQI